MKNFGVASFAFTESTNNFIGSFAKIAASVSEAETNLPNTSQTFTHLLSAGQEANG